MTADWDKWGQRIPLTVLKLENVVVTQVKTLENEGYTALQVGAGERKAKNVSVPVMGHLNKAGVEPKAILGEFRVSPDAVLPVGTRIFAQHFVPGQYVDIRGRTHGKGFQGVMKRYGFGGQPATHGVSKTHRSLGSTGACQDPGRVWKGKKMPGHMGHVNRTIFNLQVYKIDVKRDLVYVKGAVPGKAGTFVRVSDAQKIPHAVPPPFPTWEPDEAFLAQQAAWEAGVAAAAKGEGGFADPLAWVRAEQTGEDPLEALGGKALEPPFELLAPPPEHDPFAIHDWEEGEP